MPPKTPGAILFCRTHAGMCNYNCNELFVILICILQATLVCYSLHMPFRYSVHILRVNNYSCSLDLYSWNLQTTSVLFTLHASSHKTNWITTDYSRLLCLVHDCKSWTCFLTKKKFEFSKNYRVYNATSVQLLLYMSVQ